MPPGFKADPQGLAALMRGPEGPVTRHLIKVGEDVRQLARANLGGGFASSFLGPRIVKRVEVGADGAHVLVGSDVTKTRPHLIVGNPLLVFHWAKAGRVVYLRHVNHPGSDFGPFLRKALLAAVAEARFRR
jgi:hypothetical protein